MDHIARFEIIHFGACIKMVGKRNFFLGPAARDVFEISGLNEVFLARIDIKALFATQVDSITRGMSSDRNPRAREKSQPHRAEGMKIRHPRLVSR